MKNIKSKTFAQKYSVEFENVILEIVKNALKKDFCILSAENTVKSKDGGYDGYCHIKAMDGTSSTALLEAKLRTACKDLPLDDFSKSVIIAINLDVVCIFIGTNIYFSSNSIEQLDAFIFNTGLEIRTIDYKDIMRWIDENPQTCEKYKASFINELKKYAQKNYPASCRSLSIFDNPYVPNKMPIPRLYGNERIVMKNKMRDEITKSVKTFVIRGELGIGKKTLALSVINELLSQNGLNSNTFFASKAIDMGFVNSCNDFIYTIVSALWGCEYSDTVDFFNGLIEEKQRDALTKLLPNNLCDLLMKLANPSVHNIDMDVFFSYISCLYKSNCRRKKLRRVFYFFNLEYSNDESLRNLLVFIRKMSEHLSIIVCLPYTKEPYKYNNKWTELCDSITESRNVITFELEELKYDSAIRFVKDNIMDEEISGYSSVIVDYFGRNPACLTAGIELVNSDKLMLGLIKQDVINLDRTFDTSKLTSAITYVNKSFSEYQLSLEYLMLLIDSELSIEFLSKVLNLDYKALICIIESVPLFKFEHYVLKWKNRYYGNLFDIANLKVLTDSCRDRLIKSVILNIDMLNFNDVQKCHLLVKIYIEQRNIKKCEEFSEKLINYYKDSERYSDIFYLTEKLIDSELFVENVLYNILVRTEMLEAAIKIGFNGDDTDMSERFAVLKDYIERYTDEFKDSVSSLILGRFYNISSIYHLTRSEYIEMSEDIQKGLNFLKKDSFADALELQGLLCANYAIALKHIDSIEKCVEFLEDNEVIRLHPEIREMPQYYISYHTHHASLYTGCDPQKALDEFNLINEDCKKYSKDSYLHNLHNISSMKFVIGDYEGAYDCAKTVYMESYENNISVEFGRCQNVLGCLMWRDKNYDKAKYYFRCSYQHFKKHRHNTHLWAPLVNLAVLCTEQQDGDAFYYTKQALEFLAGNHLLQIEAARITEDNIPKIIMALLLILHNLELLKHDPQEFYYLFDIREHKDIEKIYNKKVKGKTKSQLFKDSVYNCEGTIMLKV